jgi:hypothetical protein
MAMLSVDQSLRPISVPATIAAFRISAAVHCDPEVAMKGATMPHL